MSTIDLAQLSVLLVEPSLTQRHIISEYLGACDIQRIDAADNGFHALEFMETHRVDLVISAMHLPDMTGVELIETMRSVEYLQDIAFILISSETHISYLEPIRQAGAIAILPKPFRREQLHKALTTTLDFLDPEPLDLDNYEIDALSILLVDDSRFFRNHITKSLRDMGIEHITQAENGMAAIPLLEENHFDLILTDYNMPEMDGKEFIQYIRSMGKFAGIPIVMVTCETDMSRLAAVDQIGVSAMVDKPFDPRTLKQLIRKSLA